MCLSTTIVTWMRSTVTPFVDSSALYAAVDSDDDRHRVSSQSWTRLLQSDESLLTSNYVVLETIALIGRRIGPAGVRAFQTTFVPALDVIWVGEPLHQRAVAALLTAGQRDLSLVDCVSFELMRDLGLDTAFAYDHHFDQQGFRQA